jgi:hypothetical protein
MDGVVKNLFFDARIPDASHAQHDNLKKQSQFLVFRVLNLVCGSLILMFFQDGDDDGD